MLILCLFVAGFDPTNLKQSLHNKILHSSHHHTCLFPVNVILHCLLLHPLYVLKLFENFDEIEAHVVLSFSFCFKILLHLHCNSCLFLSVDIFINLKFVIELLVTLTILPFFSLFSSIFLLTI